MSPGRNALAAKVARSKISADEMERRLASATAGIEAGADGFAAWAAADIVKAQAQLENLENGTGARAALGEIFRIVHDLKGQGGTFGFSLVTAISTPLADYLRQAASFRQGRPVAPAPSCAAGWWARCRAA